MADDTNTPPLELPPDAQPDADNSDQPLEQQFNQENPVGSQFTSLIGGAAQKSAEEDTAAYKNAIEAARNGDDSLMRKYAQEKGIGMAMATLGGPEPKVKMVNESNPENGLIKIVHPKNNHTTASGQSLGGDYEWWLNPPGVGSLGSELPYNNVATLESLSVDPSLQDKGYGSKLLKEFEKEAIKQGHDAIFLNASPMGSGASGARDPSKLADLIKFYEYHGYKAYGPKEEQNQIMIKPLKKEIDKRVAAGEKIWHPKKGFATGGPVKMADGGNPAPDELPADATPDELPADAGEAAPNWHNTPLHPSNQEPPPDELPASAVSDEEKYGGLTNTIAAAGLGYNEGALGPAGAEFNKAAGFNPEYQRGVAEVHPAARFIGETAGLVTGPLGKGLAAIGAATKAGAAAIGLGKIGSSVAANALEMASFQAADEADKMVLNDPNQTVDSALTNIGLGAVVGGSLGLVGSAGKALWKSTMSGKTGGILKSLANKAGGIDGVPNDTETAIAQSGMNISPELRAGLSQDPNAQQMFKTLEQSDTTTSGQALQKTYGDFRKQAADGIVNALGKNIDDLPALSDMSKYEAGKEVGNTLANEYEAQLSPLSKEFDALKSKFQDVPIAQPVIDDVVDKISTVAQREGWTISPSSDIMREVNRVIKELPNVKSLKNLTDYITAVGNNTAGDITNRPLIRAGQMMKSVLKDAEADTIKDVLGQKEGQASVDAYQAARDSYRQQSDLKDALDDRLHAGGSTSGFAKNIRTMAQTDGESIVRRLSGAGDADLLNLLQKQFPQTAQLIKDFHINNLLKSGVDKAAPDFSINSNTVLKNLNKMSPELRSFAVPAPNQVKLNAIGHILDQFEKLPHNFSNTARTIDKLFKHLPGTIVGLITALASHNPILGMVVASLVKTLGKDAPDAARLALLKYLGMPKPINAEAFKESFEMVNNALKGRQLIDKSVKNVFREGVDVLPESKLPNEKSRKQINDAIDHLQQKPQDLIKLGDKVAYYMPEHGTAMAATTSNVLHFLRSQRPMPADSLPLDPKFQIDKCKKAAYNQLLDIGEQPLIVLDKMKQGTLTAQDVMACSTMFPSLYSNLKVKLLDQLAEAKSKGTVLPYATKVGLSVFLGQPMDSTMTQPAMMSIQNIMNPPTQPMAPNGKAPRNQRVTGESFKKLPSMYQTPGQQSQSRHMK